MLVGISVDATVEETATTFEAGESQSFLAHSAAFFRFLWGRGGVVILGRGGGGGGGRVECASDHFGGGRFVGRRRRAGLHQIRHLVRDFGVRRIWAWRTLGGRQPRVVFLFDWLWIFFLLLFDFFFETNRAVSLFVVWAKESAVCLAVRRRRILGRFLLHFAGLCVVHFGLVPRAFNLVVCCWRAWLFSIRLNGQILLSSVFVFCVKMTRNCPFKAFKSTCVWSCSPNCTALETVSRRDEISLLPANQRRGFRCFLTLNFKSCF